MKVKSNNLFADSCHLCAFCTLSFSCVQRGRINLWLRWRDLRKRCLSELTNNRNVLSLLSFRVLLPILAKPVNFLLFLDSTSSPSLHQLAYLCNKGNRD